MTTRYDLIVTIPAFWPDGVSLTREEQAEVALLRLGGCTCRAPLLGAHRRTARCRLCNTEVLMQPDDTPVIRPPDGDRARVVVTLSDLESLTNCYEKEICDAYDFDLVARMRAVLGRREDDDDLAG